MSSVDLVFFKGLSFKMVNIPKWHISGCQDLLPSNTSPPPRGKVHFFHKADIIQLLR